MKKGILCFIAVLAALSVLCLGTVTASAYSFHLGDTDGDGEVSIFDATKSQRVIAEMDSDPDGRYALRGDVDQDGELTIFDVTYIQRWLAELSVEYQVDQVIDLPDPTQPSTEAPTGDPYELPIIFI